MAGHLTRDDTLTVARAVRLAGQFRQFRPGALTGLTIPTVPARLGDGEQVLLPAQPATRQTRAERGARSGRLIQPVEEQLALIR